MGVSTPWHTRPRRAFYSLLQTPGTSTPSWLGLGLLPELGSTSFSDSALAAVLVVVPSAAPRMAARSRKASSGTPTMKTASRMKLICSSVSDALCEAAAPTAALATARTTRPLAQKARRPRRWARSLVRPAAAPDCARRDHS